MLESCYDGDLFLLPREGDAAAVTTNGVVKTDGLAVMGAGIAKYARDSFPGIDAMLGSMIKLNGNHAYYLGQHSCPARAAKGYADMVHVVSFPTKERYWEDSDLSLIAQSCRELMGIADGQGFRKVYIPMPGCRNGRLDYASQVRPVIAGILDNRFICCLDRATFHRCHPGTRE